MRSEPGWRKEPLRDSRSLVVGCGFIGSHLASRLASAGAAVRILTRSPLGPERQALTAGSEVFIGDAFDSQTVRWCLREVNSVFYCAGGLLPAESQVAPELDGHLTLSPLTAFLRVLAEFNSIELTYISSGGTIYGDPESVPVDEDHPPRPISSYGRVRLAAERKVVAFSLGTGMPSRILRCSNVYGPGQPANRGQGLIATALAKVQKRDIIEIFGDGSNIRDFLLIDDLCYAAIHLIGKVAPNVINVGSGVGTSITELLEVVQRVSGIAANVKIVPYRPFDVSKIVLNIGRLKSLLNFEPTPLVFGLKKTWDCMEQWPLEPLVGSDLTPLVSSAGGAG